MTLGIFFVDFLGAYAVEQASGLARGILVTVLNNCENFAGVRDDRGFFFGL